MSRRDLKEIMLAISWSRQKQITAYVTAVDLLIVLSCLGSTRRLIAVLLVCLAWGALNAVVFPRLGSRIGLHRAGALRVNLNMVGHVIKVIASNGALPTWIWVVFFAGITDEVGAVFSRRSLVLLVAIQTALSLFFDTGWILTVIFVGITFTAYWMNQIRSSDLVDALNEQVRQKQEAEEAKERLRVVYDRMIQQEKLSSLGPMAAGVAHEINNPMAFVTTNLQQLMRDMNRLPYTPSLRKEYEDEILPETLKGVGRVNTIVADLGRFAGGGIETAVRYDLNDEIRAAIRMTRAHFDAGTVIALDLVDLPEQLGVPRQISQVLINLLVNASHAVRNGGTLSVSSGVDANDGDYVWFKVTDTGIGMSPETRARIFDPFFTTKDTGKGTGLGLAVAHGIVSSIGGCIDVESTPGSGSSFMVTLPVRAEAGEKNSGGSLTVSAPGAAVASSRD